MEPRTQLKAAATLRSKWKRLSENGQLLSEKGRALARQAAFLDDPAVPCEMDVVRQKEAAQFGEDWDAESGEECRGAPRHSPIPPARKPFLRSTRIACTRKTTGEAQAPTGRFQLRFSNPDRPSLLMAWRPEPLERR
jgi:hypothetical protein